ncbi:MAG: transcription termination/antitermination NusG family protein [Planctomycetota bacterium]
MNQVLNQLPAEVVHVPTPWSEAVARHDESAWYVLHTRSNQENAVANLLRGIGAIGYLPTKRTIKYQSRHRVTLEQPLFPGYVFLYGQRDDGFVVDRARRIVNVIPVADQAGLEWELSNLYYALRSEVPTHAHPHLKAGVKVRVFDGPLMGVEGMIESRYAPNRIILQIGMLGRAVSAEVEADFLEVIDDGPNHGSLAE